VTIETKIVVLETKTFKLRRDWLTWAALCCILLAAIIHLINAGVWHHRFSLSGPYFLSGRVSWSMPLRAPLPALFLIKGDTKKNPQKSDLQLFDRTGSLGPSHVSLADVQELGSGRYRHWKTRLFFSTRDNTDPKLQPESLTAMATVVPNPWLVTLVNWLAGLGVLRLCVRFNLVVALETVPVIGRLPDLVRGVFLQIYARRWRISSWVSAVLALSFCAIAVFGTITRFDVVRVTEKINFTKVEVGPTDGSYYQVRRLPLYRPLVEIAPIETKSMIIRIDGVDHPCVDSPGDVSRLGGGRCSYMNTYLLVSAPDNANIVHDGRKYAENFPIRLPLDVIFVCFGLALFFGIATRFATSIRRWVRLAGAGIAVVGITLTVFNLVGMNQSLRHPELIKFGASGNDVTLTYEDAMRQLDWRPDDTTLSYSSRATVTISQAVLHRYLDEDFRALHVYMPMWENWILHFHGLMSPWSQEYVFWNPRKGLERGVGLCGDVAPMLASFLMEKGIHALVVNLSGHVVTTAEVSPGIWYILDPDNGIVIPHDLKALENDPELVRSYYRPVIAATGTNPDNGSGQRMVDLYVNFFTTQADNWINGLDPTTPEAVREIWGYRLKWTLPLLLILLGGLVSLGARYHGRAKFG